MNFGAFVQKYDPLGAKLQSYDPIASAILGGGRHGPQPNVAAPKWTEVSPGRWEMEGGQQAPTYSGALGGLAGRLGMGGGDQGGNPRAGQFPTYPGMQTGGPGQMGQMPGNFPNLMTGGPGQMQQAPQWMTGGGMQQMGGGSSYQMPTFDQADPYGGGFRGNFGLGAFR